MSMMVFLMLWDHPGLQYASLLFIIFFSTLALTYDFASFFFQEKEHRGFWAKRWVAASGVLALGVWLILLFWRN